MKSYKQDKDNTKSDRNMVDDSNTTQEVAGTKFTTFGLAIDSEGRTAPTHMIPYHVRSVLARWWSNDTPGAAAPVPEAGTLQALQFGLNDEGEVPTTDVPTALTWYAPDDTAELPAVNTVARQLMVSVAEAEEFLNGVITADNSFLNYTDVPLCQSEIDRLAFWALNKDAVELDPNYAFEAQVTAVDAFTQLFVESFDFHFQFLLTLDSEYHRLRSEGPVSLYEDDGDTLPAWYNMYHYWRDRVEEVYLDTGRVTLTTGLRNANWTIRDVLEELLLEMTDGRGELYDDIILSAKGYVKAKSGASLGIYQDASMLGRW